MPINGLVTLSIGVLYSSLVGFVVLCRETRYYAADQLSGDTKRARRAILPAWRPLLVATCQVLGGCVVVASVSLAILAHRANSPWDGWAWADLIFLALLAGDGVVPAVIAQHHVTAAAFGRAAGVCGTVFAVDFVCWAARYVAWFKAMKVGSMLVLIVSSCLKASASAAILAGRLPTRVRLQSRSHRAAFVLHCAASAGFALSLGLRIDDDRQSAGRAGNQKRLRDAFVRAHGPDRPRRRFAKGVERARSRPRRRFARRA